MRELPCTHAMCVHCLRRIRQQCFYKCPVCRATTVCEGVGYGELRDKMCEEDMTDDEMSACVRFLGKRSMSGRREEGTILCRAISQGLTNAVDLILASTVDVDEADDDQYTPLFHACEQGVEMVQRVLRAGADVNLRGAEAWTALMIAAAEVNDRTDAIVALLEHGADAEARNESDATALLIAGNQGHANNLKLLLARGCDANVADEDGMTALHFACTNNASDKVVALLDAGACWNRQSAEGYDALFYACYHGSQSCVKTLLRRGALVNASTPDGWTPLTIAAQNGYFRCLETLVAGKADVNVRVSDPDEGVGWTALMAATANEHARCVSALVRHGACINAQCEDGRTALFIACAKGSTRIVRTLLQANADAGLMRGNVTCLEVASDACAKILLR